MRLPSVLPAAARPPRARVLSAVALLAACAVPLAPPAARAQVAPEAKPVIERYLAAVGGRAAVEAQRAMHVTASISAFGLSGEVESWQQAPDRRASRVTLGPFTLRDGFDGVRPWRVDQSGKLILLDGKDAEDARGSAWFENERWLAPDGGGGRVAFAGAAKDSAGEYDVLEVTPPVGRARKLYFDRATGLLARSESRNDQQTVVVSYSDHREVAGRRMPFRSVQSMSGAQANTVTLEVRDVRVNPDLPAATFAPPSSDAAAGGPRYLKTPGRAVIPFRYLAKHVWIRASVNGGPLEDFLYDTGASVTVIDSAYAARIGLAREGSLQAQGAGSAGSAALARLDALRVEAEDGDGIEMKDLRVAVLDVNSILAPFFWRECAGIIGFDVINRFVNDLDFDAGVLRLLDPAAFRYEGKGAKVPMRLAGHVPVVTFRLDGRWEGEARLDVGSSGNLDLHGPFWRRHGIDRALGRGVEVTGGGFGGTFTNRLVRAKRLEVGPFAIERPLITLSGATAGALASEDYAGNAGNALMQRFRMTLDYERREVWLEPGARFAEPDRFSRAGLQLVRLGGAIKVGQVIPGSAAAKAGIREFDEVRSVNGEPPEALGLAGITELFERGAVGSVVRVEIVRDGKVLKKTLKLADVL
uniref:PDZ domain-containing protein n=1 Tax=Eiseniibacteriota bacterium TaxID=2212470 RepID=A0A832ML04_UNCEI